MKIGKYLVGLISGLTFGMLFAPKKGEKLREEIKKKASTSGHDAVNVLIDAFKNAGTEALEEARKLSEGKEMGQVLDLSKEKMQDYLKKLEATGYDVAAKAQEKLDEIYDTATQTVVSFKKKAVNKKKTVEKNLKKVAKTVKAKVKKATPKKIQVKVKKITKKVNSK